jgi:hypothetical protein
MVVNTMNLLEASTKTDKKKAQELPLNEDLKVAYDAFEKDKDFIPVETKFDNAYVAQYIKVLSSMKQVEISINNQDNLGDFNSNNRSHSQHVQAQPNQLQTQPVPFVS